MVKDAKEQSKLRSVIIVMVVDVERVITSKAQDDGVDGAGGATLHVRVRARRREVKKKNRSPNRGEAVADAAASQDSAQARPAAINLIHPRVNDLFEP